MGALNRFLEWCGDTLALLAVVVLGVLGVIVAAVGVALSLVWVAALVVGVLAVIACFLFAFLVLAFVATGNGPQLLAFLQALLP